MQAIALVRGGRCLNDYVVKRLEFTQTYLEMASWKFWDVRSKEILLSSITTANWPQINGAYTSLFGQKI